MAYKTVQAFINGEAAPANYCFDMETDNEAYKKMDCIERYFVYKSTGKLISGSPDSYAYPNGARLCLKNQAVFRDLPDCDGSDGRGLLASDIYRILWHWENQKEIPHFGPSGTPVFNNAGLFGPDTMSSAQTLLNVLARKLLSRPENKDIRVFYKPGTQYCLLLLLEIYSGSLGAKFISCLKSFSGLTEYMKLYHTLGNFVLVPYGFNKFRAGKTADFFDSSLALLKSEGYRYIQPKTKEKLSDFKKEDFTKYINYFYLWDYCRPSVYCPPEPILPVSRVCAPEKESSRPPEYIIRPFFGEHSRIESLENLDALPKDTESFFKEACRRIRRRGLFMTILLRLKTEPALSPVCKSFFDYLQRDGDFLNTVHEDGFKTALEALGEMMNNCKIPKCEVSDKIRDEIHLIFTQNI